MRTGLTLAVLGVLAITLSLFGSSSSSSQIAAIGANGLETGNVTGWAWGADTIGSSNSLGGIGWVSFSCTNHSDCSGGRSYAVNFDQASGELSGHAWSDNLGWLSFDCGRGECFGTGETTYPDGSSPVAGAPKVTLNGGTEIARPVSGWARFCTVFESGCGGKFAGNVNTILDSTKLGGWDGWVSLSGNGYGVTVHQNDGVDEGGQAKDTFNGYAWGGGDVVGWLSFSGNGYGVIRGNQGLNVSCVPSANTAIVGVTPITWTAQGYGGVPPYTYSWTENGGSGGSGAVVTKQYNTTGSYSRAVSVSDNAGGSVTLTSCSGVVIVQNNQPNYLLRASRSAIKLSGGTSGTNIEQVTITVDPVSVGGVDFTADVRLTGTLMSGTQSISGGVVTFAPDEIVKGPNNGQTSEYGSGRVMTLTVTSPALIPGAPYKIRIDGNGGGVPASVDVGVNVEGTGAGFEEI